MGDHLLVPVREWPKFAWAFVAYLVWCFCLPRGNCWRITHPFALWMLGWCGYYAYHPCHDGLSMAEVVARSREPEMQEARG